ncbi:MULTISPECIES: CPBP family intramembrane glutamic endopeptidase [unclassified Serratia (in: enterobacteria)]|uniref:CPBP family intramembrane glutamic endopeptidase n=1 Tax=unclassified Serratia (in: enterobacteria) TaxID=2647522 RepID=UPI0005037F37|nr:MULTISPECIES: type II CAAX endopeptidase family protein [unclassified Serratia (in: enterobacteria)]KFK96210.1 CAAX protease [Serratia sp. Ag2]KFL00627.1 CAAX protease [Serratia sp. Ag1]
MNENIDRVTHALICVSVWIGWFALSFSLLLFPGYVGMYRSGMATPLLYIIFWLPFALLAWKHYQKSFGLMPLGKIALQDMWLPGFALLGLTAIFQFFGQPEPWMESLMQPSTFTKILLVITICVLAPISEEIIFRGFLLNAGIGFGHRGRLLAVVITSLLFAFAHTQYLYPVTFISLFIFSTILCEVRIRTGSLLMPMVLHSINNTVSVAWVMALS